MEQIKIYVINYNDCRRRKRMKQRFSYLNIDFEFSNGCGKQDKRIKKIPLQNRHAAPCMLAHLDAIQKFVDSKYEYGIICEDDIHIKKSFKEDIIVILNDFKLMNLDILLLGYLINFDPRNVFQTGKYSYHKYPMDLWGAQMYLINRSYALFCLSTFNLESSKNNFPFSSDWTITKNGNKVLIFPMLAVEEGNTLAKDSNQRRFHNDCHNFNYDSSYV
jgi:GR25 family glycosyltransferase involved in LPS biosynthesis